MSTILKALRRLEEDGTASSTNVDNTDNTDNTDDTLPATDPRASDELRDRILAEESAAQSLPATATASDPARTKRTATIGIATVVVLASVAVGYRFWPGAESDSPPIAVAAAPAAPAVPATPSESAIPSPPFPTVANPAPIAAAIAPSEASNEFVAAAAPADTTSLIVPVPVPIPLNAASESTGTALPSTSSGLSPSPAAPSLANAAPVAMPSAFAGDDSIAIDSLPTESNTTDEIAPNAVTPTPTVLAARETSSNTLSETARPEAASASSLPSRRPMPTKIAEATPIDRRSETAPKTAAIDVAAASAPAPPKPEPAASTPATKLKPKPSVQDRSVERLDNRGLPELTVLRTAWHPKPDRRSAKIRLEATDQVKTLREGDAIGKLVILTISPSSVLFKAGDIEIRRRVGQR
jgi:hypothetical protein